MSPDFAWDDIWRFLSLRDSNTRVVLLGTCLLGVASGVVGVFALLRKRALMGDALSHAALPGLCLAFLLLGYKSFGGLLLGASISGILGILCILLIVRFSRVQEDAAIGIVLSSFFGLGVCLSRIIQNHPNGMQAGLETFIYGKAASMLMIDAWAISIVCLIVLLICGLLFKEFTLLCFDTEYARSTGWPVHFLDLVLMTSVVAVTMVGLQSVGVVLIIALLITPAAAARFWSDHLPSLVWLSAIFGALSAATGTAISAVAVQLPTGPLIVLCAAFIFTISSLCAPSRGLIARFMSFRKVQRRIRRQNFLRTIYELLEERDRTSSNVAPPFLEQAFSFSELSIARENISAITAECRRAEKEGLLQQKDGASWVLSKTGQLRATEIVRNHRLWELYLISYADIAPTHVDTSADHIEHVLPAETISALEAAIERMNPDIDTKMPPSPHELKPEVL